MSKFQDIQKEVKKHRDALKKMLDRADALALKTGDPKLIQFLQKERLRVDDALQRLTETSAELFPLFQKELKKRTRRLELKIEKLNKSTDALVSDNFLLEYKKNDLLMLTTKLEEAYDEISLKNKEMMQQQKKIQEQAERLNAVHDEMLAKNEELEMQKEALLDQSDYLHEANETISQMHREVEKQKNEILKKNEELLILNNEKNNLIGIVAHDLKSPLNQIKGLLSLMRLTSTELTEETLGYIEMMEGSSGRLSEMIAKILDVEAIESRQLNLVLGNVDLAGLLQSLASRYALAAEQKQITLCTDFRVPAVAFVDRGYAEQVLENLVSNAIKFSPADRRIFLCAEMTGGRVICEVRDEGPGLTESDKKKLFGKYQKLSAKPTGNETSTGLGLSIVKKFVEAMEGKIWCESESGKGASFFVSFPEAKVHAL
jgi:signal transduction histidine kinase